MSQILISTHVKKSLVSCTNVSGLGYKNKCGHTPKVGCLFHFCGTIAQVSSGHGMTDFDPLQTAPGKEKFAHEIHDYDYIGMAPSFRLYHLLLRSLQSQPLGRLLYFCGQGPCKSVMICRTLDWYILCLIPIFGWYCGPFSFL